MRMAYTEIDLPLPIDFYRVLFKILLMAAEISILQLSLNYLNQVCKVFSQRNCVWSLFDMQLRAHGTFSEVSRLEIVCLSLFRIMILCYSPRPKSSWS